MTANSVNDLSFTCVILVKDRRPSFAKSFAIYGGTVWSIWLTAAIIVVLVRKLGQSCSNVTSAIHNKVASVLLLYKANVLGWSSYAFEALCYIVRTWSYQHRPTLYTLHALKDAKHTDLNLLLETEFNRRSFLQKFAWFQTSKVIIRCCYVDQSIV